MFEQEQAIVGASELRLPRSYAADVKVKPPKIGTTVYALFGNWWRASITQPSEQQAGRVNALMGGASDDTSWQSSFGLSEIVALDGGEARADAPMRHSLSMGSPVVVRRMDADSGDRWEGAVYVAESSEQPGRLQVVLADGIELHVDPRFVRIRLGPAHLLIVAQRQSEKRVEKKRQHSAARRASVEVNDDRSRRAELEGLAATRLQATERRRLAQGQMRRSINAVRLLQAASRGHSAREEAGRMREQLKALREEGRRRDAATAIQARSRSHAAHSEVQKRREIAAAEEAAKEAGRQEHAATAIQSRVRGDAARTEASDRRAEQQSLRAAALHALREASATRIQCIGRSGAARAVVRELRATKRRAEEEEAARILAEEEAAAEAARIKAEEEAAAEAARIKVEEAEAAAKAAEEAAAAEATRIRAEEAAAAARAAEEAAAAEAARLKAEEEAAAAGKPHVSRLRRRLQRRPSTSRRLRRRQKPPASRPKRRRQRRQRRHVSRSRRKMRRLPVCRRRQEATLAESSQHGG